MQATEITKRQAMWMCNNNDSDWISRCRWNLSMFSPLNQLMRHFLVSPFFSSKVNRSHKIYVMPNEFGIKKTYKPIINPKTPNTSIKYFNLHGSKTRFFSVKKSLVNLPQDFGLVRLKNCTIYLQIIMKQKNGVVNVPYWLWMWWWNSIKCLFFIFLNFGGWVIWKYVNKRRNRLVRDKLSTNGASFCLIQNILCDLKIDVWTHFSVCYKCHERMSA